MSIVKRMLSGSIWSAAGGATNKLAGMLSTIVIARVLGTEQFGEFGIVRSTLLTMLIFGSVSVSTTATKYVAQNRQNPANLSGFKHLMSSLTKLAYGVAILLTAIEYFGAHFIADKILTMPALANSLQLGAIFIFFSAICYFQSGVISGFEAFQSMAMINLFNGITVLIFLCAGAYFFGLKGIFLGLGFTAITTFILGQYFQKKLLRNFYYNNAGSSGRHVRASELISYCIPITLSGILVAPVNWACNAMLVRASGLTEVGIYEAANQWRMLILFIPTLLGQVSFSIFSSISSKQDFTSAFKINVVSTFLIAGALAAVMIYFSPYFMAIYGKQFSGGGPAMKWLCASGVIIAVNITINQAIASHGNAWHVFLLNTIWALAALIVSWYFVSQGFGAEGLAIAQFIAYALHTILQIIYLHTSSIARPDGMQLAQAAR